MGDSKAHFKLTDEATIYQKAIGPNSFASKRKINLNVGLKITKVRKPLQNCIKHVN